MEKDYIRPIYRPRGWEYYERDISGSKNYPSKKDELFGKYLVEERNRIKNIAITLDLFDEKANSEELLNRVLLELGDEVDEETTFFDKVKRMEDILSSLNDDAENILPPAEYTED